MSKSKKFRCLNFGNCDKAGKKEQFEIPEGGELKCPECGSEMIQEVKASNGMMIGIIAAAVVALGAAAFALTRGGDGDSLKATPEETVATTGEATAAADSVAAAEDAARQAVADSIAAEAEAAEAEAKALEDSIRAAEDAAKAKEKGTSPAASSASYLTDAHCEYGLYTGPAVNGKPGGGLGTIKVRGDHTIDLRNARKEKIAVKTGDTIVNVKYSDGRLVSGLVKFANGQARQFNIGL